jgi:hypothetical protein
MTRCSAKTTIGRRCKNSVHNNGVCWIHSVKQINTCSICLDDSYINSQNNLRLECGHIFCKECIFKWIAQTFETSCCPYCKKSIDSTVKEIAKVWALASGEFYYVDITVYRWDALEEIEQYYMIAYCDIRLNVYLTCAHLVQLLPIIKEDERATYIFYKLIQSAHSKKGIFRKSASGFKHTDVYYIE